MGNICFQDTVAVSEVLKADLEEEPLRDQEERILRGPVKNVPISDGMSIGQCCYKCLSSLPPTFQLIIEGDTDRTITARETLEKTVGLATSYTELGLKKCDKIFIVGENDIDANIAFIAAFLAGMASCPIDASLKSYEYQHLLKIIDPQIVICNIGIILEVKHAMSVIGLDVPIYAMGANNADDVGVARVEELYKEVPWEEFTPPPSWDQHNEPAMIVCSSGTTGLPKGVQLSQYCAVYNCVTLDAIFPPGTVMLHTSYFYWISGVLALLGSTTMGIKRVLIKTNDPLDALQATDKYKATMAVMSPTLLNGIVSHKQFQEYDVSAMRLIITGGSPLMKNTLERCKAVMPHAYLSQGYGATELGGPITFTPPGGDQLSLGKLNPNAKAKVVDRDTGELLGVLEEGEMYCYAPSIMTCYISNKMATKEALGEEGWYRTGDVGKYTADGTFYITGRAKELMKVDNHQIAPAEIEAVIAQVAGVSEVVVAGINVDENTLPMALVVRMEGSTVTAEDVIEAVEGTLSEFKQLRAGVYFIDNIPKTNTGKIKRTLAQKLGEELYNGSHAA